jgi:proteasome lid subunit RPN8/RPN11
MIHCTPNVLVRLSQKLSDRKVECVAALIGKKIGSDYYVTEILTAQNEDADPEKRFFISLRQMALLAAQAERKGCMILGIAHSHPGSLPVSPSTADILNCRHAVNAVYHPDTCSLTWFNSQGEAGCQVVQPAVRKPLFARNFAAI